jgi:hypothetical protein
MRTLIAGCLALALSAGAASTVAAQGAKEETKKAGEATKDAGKSTADAAKHAGKATAAATKKAGTKVKKTVTGTAHATCVDGTRQAGATESQAAAECASHGGVAKS